MTATIPLPAGTLFVAGPDQVGPFYVFPVSGPRNLIDGQDWTWGQVLELGNPTLLVPRPAGAGEVPEVPWTIDFDGDPDNGTGIGVGVGPRAIRDRVTEDGHTACAWLTPQEARAKAAALLAAADSAELEAGDPS